MHKIIIYFILSGILFFTSCITTGQFETAHTLPAKDYNFTVIPIAGIQPEINEKNYFDSIWFASVNLAFNKGLTDNLELGINLNPTLSSLSIILKYRFSEINQPFAFAAGPVTLLSPLSYFGENLFGMSNSSIFVNGGLAAYSSYRLNKWTFFANAHGVVYNENSIFYIDQYRQSNFGFGVNSGFIFQLVKDKMSFGLQLSIEKLDVYLENSIAIGEIYNFSAKNKFSNVKH